MNWQVFDKVHLNSASGVDSVGVLVPRERVRMERSEDVTNPEKVYFEGQLYALGLGVMHKNVTSTLSKGWSPTPHHIARF